MTSPNIAPCHPSRSRPGNDGGQHDHKWKRAAGRALGRAQPISGIGRAADIDDPEIDQAGDKLSAIEGRIANTEARTLAGVVVQIKVHGDVLKDSGAWVHTPALTRNVVTALERMEGASG